MPQALTQEDWRTAFRAWSFQHGLVRAMRKKLGTAVRHGRGPVTPQERSDYASLVLLEEQLAVHRDEMERCLAAVVQRRAAAQPRRNFIERARPVRLTVAVEGSAAQHRWILLGQLEDGTVLTLLEDQALYATRAEARRAARAAMPPQPAAVTRPRTD